MVIKGTTKSGIKYELDSRIKDDARLLFLMTMAQNTEDAAEAGKYVMDLLALIFGSNDNVYAFMNEVARTHKGMCQTKDLIKELSDMFEGLNAKNS